MKIIFIFLLTTFQVFTTLGQNAYNPRLEGAEIVTYANKNGEPLILNLFYPVKKGKKMPAIVFFFGGGWKSGSPAQFEHHCRYLASRGMVAIAAEYRVNSRHGTTPFDAVEDAADVMQYLQQNAGKLKIDPNNIAAAGGSAGGHLAATTALVKSEGRKTHLPDLLVLFNPVLDLDVLPGRQKLGDRLVNISPVHLVTSGLPPTLIFHGEEDNTVPIRSIEAFQKKMHAYGNLCELVKYENQGHAFFNYGKAENKYFNHTVFLMDQFLVQHGYLEGEPKIPLEITR